jgi:hypothetical protein
MQCNLTILLRWPMHGSLESLEIKERKRGIWRTLLLCYTICQWQRRQIKSPCTHVSIKPWTRGLIEHACMWRAARHRQPRSEAPACSTVVSPAGIVVNDDAVLLDIHACNNVASYWMMTIALTKQEIDVNSCIFMHALQSKNEEANKPIQS